jgi:3' terminal RNA ribose 2'-O-methyltransferase Hen1
VLLTVTTTHRPATDLGYLLHKHPDRVQSFTLPFGEARVFYPEATEERCTAALLLEVDPVGLVRRGRGVSSFALAEYVNDRPYVASSFLSVALVSVFKSAMAGTCKGHEELAASAIPLEAVLPVVPARGGEPLVRRLFEPLGDEVEVKPIALDAQYPDWGRGRHVGLRLAADRRLTELLNHLYVLLPVLDDDKHYWVDEAEIEKLMRRGEGWLAGHPDRDLIVRRYLKKQPRPAALLPRSAHGGRSLREQGRLRTADRAPARYDAKVVEKRRRARVSQPTAALCQGGVRQARVAEQADDR